MLKENNIILIGFMGTGKTTIGEKAAKTLGMNFIDSDNEIINLTGMSIPDLFASKGEAYFRCRETQILKKISNQVGQVISTGGGIVTRESNRKILNVRRKNGDLVIWLRASPESIWQRLKHDTSRPLLKTTNPKKQIELLLKERETLYRQLADCTIDTSDLEPKAVINRIETLFKKGGF